MKTTERRKKLNELVASLYGRLPFTDDVPNAEDLASLSDLQMVRLAYRLLDVINELGITEKIDVDWTRLLVVDQK